MIYSSKELQAHKLFYYFEQLCQIPHGSSNTKAISDYCVNFAKEHNLKYIQDSYNNVIIFKPASTGLENNPTVMLQGHLDMVNEKTDLSSHNFDMDALDLYIDGDYIKAKDTTLGADDGIAIAYALAILDDNTITHPPIEAVFTVDEEIGLLGADSIDVTPLNSRYILNLDSEEEGIFLAGCAGGLTASVKLPMNTTSISGIGYTITISGLKGGHSGTDINKGVANAHIILGRLLYIFECNNIYYGISDIQGGSKDNVIPNKCTINLVLPDDKDNTDSALSLLKSMELELKNEYSIADENICISVKYNGILSDSAILTRACAQRLTFYLNESPNGVVYMNQTIPGLVETSLNLGILNTSKDAINIGYSIRSSVASAKIYLAHKVKFLAEFIGGECCFNGVYPEWTFKPSSEFLSLCCDTYKQCFNKKADIQTIHAGVECGIFEEKFKALGRDIDIISFGPDIKAIHTVKEALSISSTIRVWEYLLELLKRI